MKTRLLITLCTAMVVGAALIAEPTTAISQAENQSSVIAHAPEAY